MDARQRWQALQSRLTAAQAAFDRGDRDTALADVDAALAIDPQFLAAAALRERIRGSDVQGSAFRVQNPKNPEPATRNPLPDLSLFEARARRKRIDRRIGAARQALKRRNLRAATAALDEVIEIDPHLPELSALTAEFDAVRRARATTHRGATTVAALTFGAVLFGATWLEPGRALLSHPFGAMAPLVEARNPEPLDVGATDEPAIAEPIADIVATSGRHDAPPAYVFTPAPAPRVVALPPTITPLPASQPTVTPPAAPPVAAPRGTATFAPVDVPKLSLAPPSRVESDDAQIARALQQYRSAYEHLDAEQARLVWPGVNEPALARAFAGLDSQALTFDACRTQVHGDGAVATCEGRMRYVPRIGSRDPRIEPRTWTFVLKRAGADWKIDTARTEDR